MSAPNTSSVRHVLASVPSVQGETNSLVKFEYNPLAHFNFAVDIWDATNPRSMINIVGGKIKEFALKWHEERPELFNLDEKELHKLMTSKKRNPTSVTNCLRLKFWIEYEKAATIGSAFSAASIYSGICSFNYFYTCFLKDPLTMAWMICPPISYENRLADLLDYSTMQIRDILDLPITDKNGRLDYRLINAKIKIREQVEKRLIGDVEQRISQTVETKSVVAHVGNSIDPEHIRKIIESMDANQMRDHLRALKRDDKTKEIPTDIVVENGSDLNEPESNK